MAIKFSVFNYLLAHDMLLFVDINVSDDAENFN